MWMCAAKWAGLIRSAVADNLAVSNSKVQDRRPFLEDAFHFWQIDLSCYMSRNSQANSALKKMVATLTGQETLTVCKIAASPYI